MPRQARQRERGPQTKHWCFTINNPTPGDCLWDPELMSYLIVGNEVGENGTPHLQCYVCFKVRKRLAGVKRVFPRAHVEACQGTPIQNIVYCSKDGDATDYGVPPLTQGDAVKERWAKAFAAAKRGDFDLIPCDMKIKYYHAFKRIYQDNPVQVQDLDQTDNVWIFAPSDYGKSTYARETWPDFYDKSPNKWWTGYKNEGTILCDDFGPKQCQFLGWYMKRWADKFPFPIETKGGGCAAIRPERIVVTSQYRIEECFEDILTVDAMNRRFRTLELERWQVRLLRTEEEIDSRDSTATTEVYGSSDDEEPIDLDEDPFNLTYSVKDVFTKLNFEDQNK